MQAETSVVYSESREDQIPTEDRWGARETAAGEKSSPVVTGRHPCKNTNATKNLDSKVPVGKSSPSKYNVSHHKQGRGCDRGDNETGDSDKIPPSAGDYDVSLLNKDTKHLSQGAPHHQSPPTMAPETAVAPHEPTGENNHAAAEGKFETHLKDFRGTMVMGDYAKVTIGANSSTDAGAPQHQSPPATTRAASPERTVQRDVTTEAANGPKFSVFIEDSDSKVVLGDHANVNVGANSSTGAAPQHRNTPPPATATTEWTAERPPTKSKYVIKSTKGAPESNIIIGDGCNVNIGS